MLGDVDEAEDMVQDAFLRWHQADQQAIRSPEAWLVTVVTRLCMDRLRRLATERSAYPGPWLPEPISTDTAFAPSAPPPPDRQAELASDLSIALLVLLERLAPEERAAFVLREVFGTDYAEIARILERSPDAVRQMVHRARTRVQVERKRVTTPPGEHERLLDRFIEAVAKDDAEGLLAVLASDVELTSDGGGRVPAARNVLIGASPVSRLLFGVARKYDGAAVFQKTQLNGEPALLARLQGRVIWALTACVEPGRIRALFIMRNPEKLRRVLEPTVPLM
jgi:RNA polymerase sigma-70 factor, ECF subfamily